METKTKILLGILIILVGLAIYFTLINIFYTEELIYPIGTYCVSEIVCGEHILLNVSMEECVVMYESDLLENNCSYKVVE